MIVCSGYVRDSREDPRSKGVLGAKDSRVISGPHNCKIIRCHFSLDDQDCAINDSAPLQALFNNPQNSFFMGMVGDKLKLSSYPREGACLHITATI